jgi:hypothetical protein
MKVLESRSIVFAASFLVSLTINEVSAAPSDSDYSPSPLSPSVSISNNKGGVILNYMTKLHQYRKNNVLVKFNGRCDSACTLYLSLPREQTCISRKASFRFHLPMHPSPKTARAAHGFMLRQYPEWVRTWIEQQGGLTRKLKTMNYTYASRFIPPC